MKPSTKPKTPSLLDHPNRTRGCITRTCIVVIVAAVVSLSMPSRAAACACCSDPGDRLEFTEEVDEYIRDQLLSLRFHDTAELRALVLLPDSVVVHSLFDTVNFEGLVVSFEPYGFQAVAGSGGWTFHLTNEAGEQGTMEFPVPPQLVRFTVDPHDGEKSAGGGPRMYHEWRLEGPVALSGIVGNGDNQARATLILQGHGNRCVTAEDLSHWNLFVHGPGVRFALVGTAGEKQLERYDVHGVTDGDALNLRSGPGANYPVIAEIPPIASGVSVSACKSIEDQTWCAVTWRDEAVGWASARYLIGEETGLPPR